MAGRSRSRKQASPSPPQDREAVKEARRQANAAEDALIAADRPWIEVVSLSVHRVDMMGFGDEATSAAVKSIAVEATATIKNIGRSPAQRVFVLMEPVPHSRYDDLTPRVSALCRRAVADRRFVDGVLFPDATRATHHTLFGAPADLRRTAERIRATIREEAEWRRQRGAEVSGGGSDADEARLMDAELAIAGCVTYVLPAGRAVGQTGFLYDVARNCGDAELVLPCSLDLNRPGDYERLSVTGATYTGFAR
jgi:hypothetical protein